MRPIASASGSRLLLYYNVILGEVGEYEPTGTPFGADLAAIATADFGAVAVRPVAPVDINTGSLEGFYGTPRADRIPFTIDVAGYDGDADLPTVSITSFLAYGEDGTEEGEATITADPAVPAPPAEVEGDDEEGEEGEVVAEGDGGNGTAAHRGRGVYYATLLQPADYSAAFNDAKPLAPALIDTRLAVVSAVEVNGRETVPVRGVVRLWTSGKLDYAPGADEPVPERWSFQGPPTGFWATVRHNAGGGEYTLTPALSAWANARYVTAEEVSGNRFVPRRVRAFVDFLASRLGPEPYWDQGLKLE